MDNDAPKPKKQNYSHAHHINYLAGQCRDSFFIVAVTVSAPGGRTSIRQVGQRQQRLLAVSPYNFIRFASTTPRISRLENRDETIP